jgi:hypothetical protein
MRERRTPSRGDLARRLAIGVLVLWGAGSLMVASDVIASRGIAFVVGWAVIFVVGLALLAVLRRMLAFR